LTEQIKTIRQRFFLFGLWILVCLAIFWAPATGLLRYSMGNDNASHIVLIPVIAAWLVYLEQKRIFQTTNFDYVPGAVLTAVGILAALFTMRAGAGWSPTDRLTGYTLALVMLLIAGFTMIFGRRAASKGRFSLLFLLLMVPLPDAMLDYFIYWLQKGSADIAEMIFDLAGVPALRDGFVFHLAHLSIEVAKECSGIRSSLALLILALLVGHLFLRTFWKQALFVVLGLVIMIVKNGIRIATLTILAQYVDSSFLFGRLHHEGGIVFFVIGLLLLLPVFWLLQRGERAVPAGSGNGAAAV
jgi:exosortase